MTSARHRQVVEHAPRRRYVRLAGPASAAALLTTALVGGAVAVGTEPADVTSAGEAARAAEPAKRAPMKVELDPADSPYLAARIGTFSRSAKRVTLAEKPDVKDRQFMTADLNLWAEPKAAGKPIDILDEGDKVALTGVAKNGFAQILFDDQIRWVNRDYLADKMPKEPKPTPETAAAASGGGISSAPCADGSGVESGLTDSAVRLYRAVCAEFPALSSYGGYAARGEHGGGKSIDFMVSDPALGQAVANWALANNGELDLFDIIWSKRIWTIQRASEGWRAMSDRGSATANHFDHVHIMVN